jgi:hypothetical protein
MSKANSTNQWGGTGGGTRKIADPPSPPCPHPEHRPPGMMVFEPGMYEHTCPECGNITRFSVPATYL